LKTLVGAGIVPVECCKRDRRSGEVIWGNGVAGALVERKRKVEREQIKEGLRVWLERKAREISARKKDGSVGIMAWRFSRRMKFGEQVYHDESWPPKPSRDKVGVLKRFFEGLAS
jgi:hypothetical protein